MAFIDYLFLWRGVSVSIVCVLKSPGLQPSTVNPDQGAWPWCRRRGGDPFKLICFKAKLAFVTDRCLALPFTHPTMLTNTTIQSYICERLETTYYTQIRWTVINELMLSLDRISSCSLQVYYSCTYFYDIRADFCVNVSLDEPLPLWPCKYLRCPKNHKGISKGGPLIPTWTEHVKGI